MAYTYDAAIGQKAPVWGDDCPGGIGPEAPGCAVSGRVSRLVLPPDGPSREEVLIEDWCGQFDSHSMGSLVFDTDGVLYVSAGDGASSQGADYGQLGDPANPCGDPGVLGTTVASEFEGGALRSQDLLSPADPVGLSGTIIRVDPKASEELADNPLAVADDANARRIVAHGLRNPFCMALDPTTSDLAAARPERAGRPGCWLLTPGSCRSGRTRSRFAC